MLKETDEDIEVKNRLRASTIKEITRYAGLYADLHIVGQSPTDDQNELVALAKRKGYPKGLIRKVGSFKRRGMLHSENCVAVIGYYLDGVGL